MRRYVALVGMVGAGIAAISLSMGNLLADDAPASGSNAAGSPPAAASGATGGKCNKAGAHQHGVHGKVTAVTGNSITVEIHHHSKGQKGQAAAGQNKPEVVTKTFTLGANTKNAFVTDGGSKPATVGDLKVGEHVGLKVEKGTVESVAIMEGHHHHKKPAADAAKPAQS